MSSGAARMNVGNISIRSKLTGIIAITTLLTLLIGFTTVCVQSVKTLKNDKFHESQLIGLIVSDYSVSPLAFGDEDGAIEMLSRLSRIPNIERGILFDEGGRLFAQYHNTQAVDDDYRGGAITDVKGEITLEKLMVDKQDNSIQIVIPVEHQEQSYGTLFLQFSTAELDQRILVYIGLVVTIAFFTFIIAIVFASRLVKVVSDPILKLAEAARVISSEGDYNIAVEYTNHDEIGELYTAFNMMLKQIQLRRQALEKSVDDLDNAVTTLTASNEQLERFAYICSHDLQEPIRMVKSFSVLLDKHLQGKLDKKGEKYLKFITDGAFNAQNLIVDVLMFCRIDQTSQQFEDVSLAELCESVAVALTLRLEQGNCLFTWGEDLPIIRGVRSQLYQVLLNLVSNGLKFNQSEKPCVTVHVGEQEECWNIIVKDNGIGIDPDYHAKVFEMFHRLNRRGEYPGTGMGLAICKKVVERNNGTMQLESSVGQGCCFIIDWPKTRND